jgi:surfeit locus 1 family protein
LLRLGFWQLDRAEEKRQIQADHNALVNQQPVNYTRLGTKQWQNYQNVIASGEFRKEQWLIDNQIYQGRFGYELIQPFVTSTGDVLLVSRGWVEGSLDRSKLPQVETPAGQIDIQGYLYSPTVAFQLENTAEQQQWPRVEQAVDTEKMYKAVGGNDKIGRPYVLRLQQNDPSLLTAHWQIINTQPEKHTAYAMQWFGMAILLVILFVLASVKREIPASLKN